MTTRIGFPSHIGDPPPSDSGQSITLWLTRLGNAVGNLMQGKSNNTGTVTLTALGTSTTLTDSRIGPKSVILFMPTTAAAAVAAAGLYVSARTNGSATLTHAAAAAVDQSFGYAVVG